MSIVADVPPRLSSTRPLLAAEWHPDRNGPLTPDDVTHGSQKKAWWRCSKDASHEWPAVIAGRSKGSGCPVCSGRIATATTSLRALRPGLAAEWHPDRNGDLTPEVVTPGSGKRAWWRCSAGPKHEWEAVIGSRSAGHGCPHCAGQAVTPATSLRALFPGVAAEWHPTRNGSLTPEQVVPGSEKVAWWRCSVDGSHEWQADVFGRARKGRSCPRCKTLRILHPVLAAQWHPTRNGDLTPDDVTPGSRKRVWWRCDADPPHEWQTAINNRVNGTGCVACSGRVATPAKSLEALRPDLAAQWHPTRNGALTPDRVVPGSGRKAWWRCDADPAHEWEGVIHRRAAGVGCPSCGGRVATPRTSLRAMNPEIAAEWHPHRNGRLAPEAVVPGSARKVWWSCKDNPTHEWQMVVYARTRNGSGCPACNKGWTLGAIRGYVCSLGAHLADFTPAELYLLFQQNGLLGVNGKGKSFVKALATGRFPAAEVEKFARSEPSLVDDFLNDPTLTLGDPDSLESTAGARSPGDPGPLADLGAWPRDEGPVDRLAGEEKAAALPLVEASRALAALGHAVVSSADEEAVEFLLASAVAKAWAHAFRDEAAAVAQVGASSGGDYAERARARFLDEYRRARDLPIPPGYAFAPGGKLAPPNLMQRLVAVRVRDARRVGNWSGTGAGKTLSAVLASRVVGSRSTIICCPNAVVEGWAGVIREVYPDSLVATRTLDGARASATEGPGGEEAGHRYLVLNYEAFQQPDSPRKVRALVGRGPIEMVIIDEIHQAKQRDAGKMSRRRENVAALVSLATGDNPDLHVLGMSATPVVNNLQEGKSLIELITGVAHDELKTKATVPNCMRLHQRLATLGIRWMPEYDTGFEQVEVPVDCSAYLAEIRALGRGQGNPLALEQVLVKARLPSIRAQVRPGTLIYTHYIRGIDRQLREAIEADGWRVGFYCGEDKSGRDPFLKGDVDVLIATGALGTGVDGLQRVCNRLIVAVLPWTAADFDQLKGRLFRQGQRDPVTVIVPVTSATVAGAKWSWCESKLERLRYKRSIADAAVDGVVPEGQLRTEEQAYRDLMAWLERLDWGQLEVISRGKIAAPVLEDGASGSRRRRRTCGDFSGMNRAWNAARGGATHGRLRSDPGEWGRYHALFREARLGWEVVPCEEVIRWCRKRSGYVIGDFGCGEATLAARVSDLHTVHSFDHVAANDGVVACDLSRVPLGDATLDLAVFSLSLMGANFADYLGEAHRTLKLDGELQIYEATSRFSDRDRFASGLRAAGFDVVGVEDRWKFTRIRALRGDRRPREGVPIRF